jgi:hypothetical protein
MGATPPHLRKPAFLEGIGVRDATMVDFSRTAPTPPRPSDALTPAPPTPPPPALPTPPPAAFPAGLAELPPPPSPPRPAFVPDALAERVTHAVESLKLQSSRLAELARSDALEIGLLVAERILEQEVATNPRALMSLVRSAMRRLAESRQITIFLCPADAERLSERVQAQDPEVLAIATVKLVADAALKAGDCRVESELGSVDGKLSTRFNEVRRSLDAP